MVPMPSSAGDPPGTIPEAPSPAQPLPEDRKGPFQTQLRTPAVHLQSPAPAARFGSGLPLSGRGKRKKHPRQETRQRGGKAGQAEEELGARLRAPQRPEATRPTGPRRGNPDAGTGPRDGGAGGGGVFPPGLRGRAARCTPGTVVLPASAPHSTAFDPPPPAPLQRRPPQPRWRHLHELTSEGTSPVMTSAPPALCSGRNWSPAPSAAEQLLPPYSTRQRLGSFRAHPAWRYRP